MVCALFVATNVFAVNDANNFGTAVLNLQDLIATLTRVAFALAFLAFFWGFFKFTTTSSEEQKKNATVVMTTAVAIIFIMLSVWGLVALIQGTFMGGSSDGVDDVNFPEAKPNIY